MEGLDKWVARHWKNDHDEKKEDLNDKRYEPPSLAPGTLAGRQDSTILGRQVPVTHY